MAQATQINYTYLGQAPLDAKLAPLYTIDELSKINTDLLYEGAELIVLNINPEDDTDVSNIPTRFALKYNEKFEFIWKVKDILTVKTFADIKQFEPYLLEGTKIIVLSDINYNNQLTEYISGTETIVTDEGVEETVVVYKKVNNDGVITFNDLALKRLNNHEIGALIYLQDTIYSYTKEENEELITVYTDKLGDIPEDIFAATGYTENPTGFYVLQKIDGKEVLSQMIVNNEINSINIPIGGDDTYDLTQTGDNTGDLTQTGDETNVIQ